MKYLVVEKNLNLKIQLTSSRSNFSVPSKLTFPRYPMSPIEHTLYWDVLYPFRHALDRKRGVGKIHYSLAKPDPWLVALAAIMWQGIIQGLAWDIVKLAVLSALKKLKKAKLAPQYDSKKRSETSIGFTWVQYSSDGRQLYKLFLGLKRVYKKSGTLRKTSPIPGPVRKSKHFTTKR